MKRKTLALGGVLVAVVLTTTACDWTDKMVEPFQDAPRSNVTNGAPADIVEMPNGFSNLATKCGPGGMRYTVAYHGDSPYASIAVTADPACAK